MQGLVVVGLVAEEMILECRRKLCQSHWSTKYRSRSPGQGTCQVRRSGRCFMQGLMVV